MLTHPLKNLWEVQEDNLVLHKSTQKGYEEKKLLVTAVVSGISHSALRPRQDHFLHHLLTN